MNMEQALKEINEVIKDLDNPDNEETLKYLRSTAEKMRMVASLIDATDKLYKANKCKEDVTEYMFKLSEEVCIGLEKVINKVKETEKTFN